MRWPGRFQQYLARSGLPAPASAPSPHLLGGRDLGALREVTEARVAGLYDLNGLLTSTAARKDAK